MDSPRPALDAKLAEIDDQMATMEKKPVDQGSISFGKRIGEGTSMAVDRLAQVAVHDKLQVIRGDVVRAMEKLDDGTYGSLRRVWRADPRGAARGAALGRPVCRGRSQALASPSCR